MREWNHPDGPKTYEVFVVHPVTRDTLYATVEADDLVEAHTAALRVAKERNLVLAGVEGRDGGVKHHVYIPTIWATYELTYEMADGEERAGRIEATSIRDAIVMGEAMTGEGERLIRVRYEDQVVVFN